MRFGCCVPAEKISLLAEAGYDYCELPARAVAPLEDDATAEPLLRALEAAPLRPEAFNVLVPAEVPLVGPAMNMAQVKSYFQRVFERMARVGGQVAVLGSGAARRIPEDMPRNEALDQLAQTLALARDAAQRVGMDLALEHLNKGECNVFNSIRESQQFIEDRGLDGMRVLADLYHIELEHEPLSSVREAAPVLAHVHVAGGERDAPFVEGYDYAGFMRVLHEIGYDRRISAECHWSDFANQVVPTLAFMRAQWDEVA